MAVIRGGSATPANKDFIKTKMHHVFHSGADCYEVQYDCCDRVIQLL